MAEQKELSREELKLIVVKAATSALDLKKKNSSLGSDDVIAYMMTNFKELGKAKLVGIAAASKAIDYKLRKAGTDKDILTKVMKESGEIIDSVLDN